jgi:hypothetical protein
MALLRLAKVYFVITYAKYIFVGRLVNESNAACVTLKKSNNYNSIRSYDLAVNILLT